MRWRKKKKIRNQDHEKKRIETKLGHRSSEGQKNKMKRRRSHGHQIFFDKSVDEMKEEEEEEEEDEHEHEEGRLR